MPNVTATRTRKATIGLALAVAGAVVLGGCSAGSSGGSSSSSAGRAAPAIGKAEPGAVGSSGGAAADSAGGSSASSAGGISQAVPAALLAGRKLVLDGSLAVTVPDVLAAAARVRGLAVAAGGYVADEQTGGGDGIEPPVPTPVPDSQEGDAPDVTTEPAPSSPTIVSVLTLRVPSANLSATTDRVAALGHVTDRTTSSQDVTQTSIDVASRLSTQRASIARIRALLAQATRIPDIISIESELTTREATLESMEAQLKNLDDSAQLATLTVTLTPPGATHHEKKAATGFLSGLHHGWHGFTVALTAGLTVLGAVLPFAVVLALIGFPAWRIWRRRRPGSSAATPVPEL